MGSPQDPSAAPQPGYTALPDAPIAALRAPIPTSAQLSCSVKVWADDRPAPAESDWQKEGVFQVGSLALPSGVT